MVQILTKNKIKTSRKAPHSVNNTLSFFNIIKMNSLGFAFFVMFEPN